MRIIFKRTLIECYKQSNYQDNKGILEAWHKEVASASWDNTNELKEQYKNASIVANNRVVFNIHGNKYRLVVKINYQAKIVFIRFIGTHSQYDKINVEEI